MPEPTSQVPKSRALRPAVIVCCGAVMFALLLVAYVDSRKPRDPEIEGLAKIEGIPVADMQIIGTCANGLSKSHTISEEEWRSLVKLTHDSNDMTRFEAFNAMGGAHGSPFEGRALGEVKRMSSDRASKVQANYPWVLFMLRSRDAYSVAQRALQDPRPEIHNAAQMALDNMSDSTK